MGLLNKFLVLKNSICMGILLSVDMSFFNEVLKFASMGVMAWGAGLAVVGIINFSEGHSQQNAAKKEEGMGKLIGGGVIFIVGALLVPKIIDLLKV